MNYNVSLLMGLVLPVSLSVYGTEQAKKNPNVIIVMTDDQGYGELSFHGNPVLKTPFLDQFASHSLRFTDFHVAPMCAPTRGQLITGLDAARNGAINVSSGRGLVRPELATIGNIFSENGYNTGIFGKWHIGDNYPFRPEDRGFQESIWFPSSHIGAVPDYWGNDYFDDVYIHNGKQQQFNGYCTDIFFEKATEFIKKSVSDGVPFFAYIPTNAPHGPLNAKEEDIRVLEAAFKKSKYSNMDKSIKDQLIRYLSMIVNIDNNMGKLIKFLADEGLEDNTILIFTTDNGSTHANYYYDAGMRGVKTELWEGGHRVPLFVRWPGGKFTSPRNIDGLTQIQDILPTLVDLCKLKISDQTKFDGISLAPVLRGEKDVPHDRMLVINYSRMPSGFNYPSPYSQSILRREGAGVLWKRWRLLEDRELYDLITDPLQQTNVIEKHPEVVKKMRDHLNNWWDDVKQFANEPQRIIIGSENADPTLLSSCDWLDVFVDQQKQVLNGVRKSGYWNLDVEKAGEYEFELRRWPVELNLPIKSAGPEDGVLLPITKARLFISGVNHLPIADKSPYGFEGLVKSVLPDDTSSTFTVKLDAGPVALHTWFDDDRGETICSAYYVVVRKK